MKLCTHSYHGNRICNSHTVCALIFAGFNVCGFRGLAAICKSFVCKNLDINGYAQNNGRHSLIKNAKFVNVDLRNINPTKIKAHTVYHVHWCASWKTFHFKFMPSKTSPEHTYTCTHTRTHTRTQWHTHTHTHAHACMHARTHTCTHSCTQHTTHTRAHTVLT